MALFVHLTPEKNVRAIVRSGIRKGTHGVFCLPILPSYMISHQWLRELRRSGQRTFVAVDFRIPDDEPVSVGHYGGPALDMTAAQAVAVVRERDDLQGYEVVVPRAIARSELHAAPTWPATLRMSGMPAKRCVQSRRHPLPVWRPAATHQTGTDGATGGRRHPGGDLRSAVVAGFAKPG
jgi:hypothetical protein